MHSWARTIIVSALLVALAGCVAAPMRDARFQGDAEPMHALVTFVRESVFMGDGMALDLWDGDTFVGTLSAGTLVQYKALPGAHVFMAKSENWSYVKAELRPGKHYVVKANMFPGVITMRSALTPVESTDQRLVTWSRSLTAKEVMPEEQERYASTRRQSALAALAEYRAGSVKYMELTDAHVH